MTVIAVFGATGQTGHRVVTRALAAGYEVRALVRDPARLAAASPALTVIRGDVLDADAVDQTVAGSDAVLSLFGQVKGSPPTLQIGRVGVDASTQISRDDLADFILTQIEDRTFIGQMPFVSA